MDDSRFVQEGLSRGRREGAGWEGGGMGSYAQGEEGVMGMIRKGWDITDNSEEGSWERDKMAVIR